MNIWVSLFILQLQCGEQQWGDTSLQYGTAIAIESGNLAPRAYFFQQTSDKLGLHPWCQELSRSFENGNEVEVLVSPDGNIICIENC